jgi:hypothetical protein
MKWKKLSLRVPNKKKSLGEMSGEYAGCASGMRQEQLSVYMRKLCLSYVRCFSISALKW